MKGNAKKKEEATPLPPTRMSHVTDKEIVETVVQKGIPRYAVYDRETGRVRYADSFLGFIPMHREDGTASFVTFPSAAEPCGSDVEMHAELCAYIRRWVDVEEKFEKMAALYAMFTWVYHDFLEVPYLRVLADLGSGKTRLGLQVLGEICYRSFGTIAASSISPLFRTMDMTGGTLILDEADIDNSEKNAEIIQMINCGYLKRSGKMMRSDLGTGGKWVPRSYCVFGPKVIISRESFKDTATESRCFTVKMRETKRDDLPYIIDESLMAEGERLRNRLLTWRFRSLGTRRAKVDRSFEKFDVPARMKQLLLLMSAVVTDPSMTAMLRELALSSVADNAASRANSAAGEIAAIVVSFGRGAFVSCTEIADIYNNDKNTSAEKKHPRSVGYFLREQLGLDTEKVPGDKKRRLGVRLTDDQMETVCRKYDITPPPAQLPLAQKKREECGDCYLHQCKVHLPRP